MTRMGTDAGTLEIFVPVKTAAQTHPQLQPRLPAPSPGTLPQTGATPVPEGRFAVKLVIDEKREKDKDLFLAAGARGAGAIYTDHLAPIHIIRKVLLRVDAYLNWVIIKHHISLH